MDHKNEMIYVGYLTVPRMYAWMIRVCVPILLGAVIGLGFAVALTMDRAGTGVWAVDKTTQISGVLRATPYVHLETSDGPILLVEAGKFGTANRFALLGGRQISVEGTSLSRGSLRILEVSSHAVESEIVSAVATISLGRQLTAYGEIVDVKCYLGAMKPGDGKTHKACAILCIRGGIPPLFVGRTADGDLVWAVVTGAKGQPMPESLLGYVGEPVTVSGTLLEHGTLPTIRIELDGIRFGK